VLKINGFMDNLNIPVLPKALFLIAAALIVAGLVIWVGKGKINFNWFGNLPGDFKVQRDNFSFYAPLASMLLVSVVLNVLLRVVRYFF
jgi:hypothetical protein